MSGDDSKFDRAQAQRGVPRSSGWDHSARAQFVSYYAQQSVSAATYERFRGIRDNALRVLRRARGETGHLAVADIGCGAGTLSALWAEAGHSVYALDLSSALVTLADERVQRAGLSVSFCVGTATRLPWRNQSMDVCLIPELLEHIRDWEQCLDECARVLKPSGILFLSTNNKLCPKQQEFDLPLYSWYPTFLKRRYERLAASTRPELANYATYPAVNWFTFYGLQAALRRRGLRAMDRFDAADASSAAGLKRLVLTAIRRLPPLRVLAHFVTPYTVVFAVKERGRDAACQDPGADRGDAG